MGDIYPYGPAAYITYDQARAVLVDAGFSAGNALIGAAVGTAESSLDWRVINDTPSTGDYSVGIWQINYYGSLYAGRTAAYGTPKSLVTGGAGVQARAAYGVWRGQGWSAWSTYSSGAYLKYLQGNPGNPGGHIVPGGPPNTEISPPTEDYSATVRLGAESLRTTGAVWQSAALILSKLRK